MATAEQLKALVESYSERDDERFMSVALQVAAHSAKQGHVRLARDLRELVEKAKSQGHVLDAGRRPVPVAQPRGDLAGLLSVVYPATRLAHMALSPKIRGLLERVLLEQRQQDRLRSHGLPPRRKLLLVGPPGTGKTMTAAALSGELGWPLFTVQLDGLITKFMGETAAKLRLVFDALARTRGVYLFDEFDAIGKRRNETNDVGEIRRVLNSFLQFLEQDESTSIIIAGTNHPELLDPALFRRFDDVIQYDLPTEEQVIGTLRDKLALFAPAGFDFAAAAHAATGLSHAEITRACQEALKDALLTDREHVELPKLERAFQDRRETRR